MTRTGPSRREVLRRAATLATAGTVGTVGGSGPAERSESTRPTTAETDRLLPTGGTPNRYDSFGEAVAVGDGTALVGTGTGGVVRAFDRSGGGWDPVDRLTGGGDRDGRFGHSVAVDGDTAVVGAPVDDANGDRTGAAHVFERSGGGWSRRATVVADDGDPGDRFGVSVAVDGDVAVVGAPFDGDPHGENAGSAYVLERAAGSWTRRAKLVARDGDPGDRFGHSVAVGGDVAVVGAPRDEDPNGANAGAAYAFERSGDDWPQRSKLAAADGTGGDAFGVSVAVDGGAAVVGADLGANRNGTTVGVAYAFEQTGGDWVQGAKFVAPGGGPGDFFGTAVALDGGTAVVGAPFETDTGGAETGAAYAFERSGGDWTRAGRLATGGDGRFGHAVAVAGGVALVGEPDDVPASAGAAHAFASAGSGWTRDAALAGAVADPGDRFGDAVGVDGTTAVVGASRDDDPNGPGGGAAYVYDRAGGTWSQRAQLAPGVGRSFDEFGRTVGVDGSTVVVGAPFDDNPRGTGAGAAYVYERAGGDWTPAATLTAADGDRGDRLGTAVDASGDVAVAGAPGASDAGGAAYVFERSGAGNWSQVARLTPGGGVGDRFGVAVAVEGDAVLVGAPGGGDGAVHVFDRSGGDWGRRATLIAPDGRAAFGVAVALGSDAALVGAPGGRMGAAHAYERSGGDPTLTASLLPGSDGTAEFGRAVDLDADVAAVGDPARDGPGGENAGAATVFERAGGDWSRLETLAADVSPGAALGSAVGVAGGTVLAGAPAGDPSGPSSGAVPVFGGLFCEAAPAVVEADQNGDCAISTAELRAAVSDWARGEYTTAELRRIIQAWAASG